MKALTSLATLAVLAAIPCRAVNMNADLVKEMPADSHHMKIGDPAPDFSLVGIDGKTYTLADFKDAKILIVAFLSNHCPVSHAAETRLLPLYNSVKDQGVAMVAINPNSPAGLDIGELGYSKYNDTLPEMKLYAKERGFDFPYLYDGDTQVTAKAYGCICTPHIFIFDADRKLRYMGRLDDSQYPEANTVSKTEAKDALMELLAGEPVAVPVTRPFGCATKWLENKPHILAINEKWESTPVTLDNIDAAGIAALLKNDTQNVRMINVWATWCVPCVEEFPNVVTLIRQFQNRNFEMITIASTSPKDGALHFLEKQHAALPNRVKRLVDDEGRDTDNYLFNGKSDALQAALDPEMTALPYTLIIAPGGKILYRHTGAFDMAEVREVLIDQMSPYYSPPVAKN